MPEMKLDVVDAAELAELLQFLSQWLARDPVRPGDSLAQFVGHLAYGLAQLRDDLQRLVFLLGGSDGSAPTRHSEAPSPCPARGAREHRR